MNAGVDARLRPRACRAAYHAVDAAAVRTGGRMVIDGGVTAT
jgi:hypothetical protein